MKRTFASGFATLRNLKTLLFLVTPVVLALATAAPRAEAYDNTQGDFILGFRQVASTNSILVDIGPITDFTVAQSFNLGGIGSLLASTYGSGWATDPNVYFSLAATTRPQDGTTTVNYVTSPEYPATGVGATIWPRLTQTNSTILKNKIIKCGDDFNMFIVQSGTSAVLEPSTSPDAYQNFMPGGSSDAGHATQGNIGWGFFNPTPEGSLMDGTAGVILHLIQLVPGFGANGTDLGDFALSADGNTLTFTPAALVTQPPPPTPTPVPTPTPTPVPTPVPTPIPTPVPTPVPTPPPVPAPGPITGAKVASVDANKPFSFQIVSSNATSYAATGLPAGLSVDFATGLISGKPKVGGTFAVELHAGNAAGTVSAVLTLKVLPLVSLKATVAKVTEGTGGKGEFLFTLSAGHKEEITVHYHITGEAINGTDYDKLSDIIKFTPGELRKFVRIIPKGNLEGLAEKAVKIELEAGPQYSVETKEPQKVTIFAGG